MRARRRGSRGGRVVIRLLFVLATVAVPAGGGEAPTVDGSDDGPLLTQEALARGVQLRGGWRFRAGDEPTWADPELNDADWRLTDPGSLGRPPGLQGLGWLRHRLHVDPSVEYRVIGVTVRQSGASELFLDGRRVARLGVVSADPALEVAWQPRWPVAIPIEPGRDHLLAVRLSLAHGHELSGGLRGVQVRVGDLDLMTRRATRRMRQLVPYMAGAGGLAGALALVHGLLFLLDRRAREHAYFAVFAAFLALDVLADMMTNVTSDLGAQLVWFRIGVPFLVGMLMAGIQLELVLFERRRGAPFWVLAATGSGMVVWVWSIPALREIWILVIFMVAAVAEMLRLAVQELLRHRSDSGVVAGGLAILALSFTDFFAGYVGLPSIPAAASILIGWGAAVVSLSWFIARRASRTNRELRQRLDQVEELTRQAIDQERRVALERAERRVIEAENTRKARELTAARELQLAMLPREPPHLPAVEVVFRMRTATEVGGDYYDFAGGAPGACTIAVGDATGHGMHAGMVVAVAKSVFKTLGPTHEPGEVLTAISRRLGDLRRRGATMAFVLLRVEGARLDIAGAAMPPLLVWRAAGHAVEEVPLSALPLGSRLDEGFAEAVVELAPGDTALVSTDGLAETRDPSGDSWGYDRVAATFAREAGREIGSALDAMLLEAETFSGAAGWADDVTLVAIRATNRH